MVTTHHLYNKVDRLPFNPQSDLQAVSYTFSRIRQGMRHGVHVVDVYKKDGAWVSLLGDNNQRVKYIAIVLLQENTGKGLYRKVYNDVVKGLKSTQPYMGPYPVLTFQTCGITNYLDLHKIPYICINDTDHGPITSAYNVVRKMYGSKRANRTNILYMNHIDEGLYILDQIKADDITKAAFCLHPVFQTDSDLKTSIKDYPQMWVRSHDVEALILAMEYRNIANQYLSKRSISSIEEITLSPLHKVNQMLVADKIQNRMDFHMYNSEHPRAGELAQYFENWMNRLSDYIPAYCEIVSPLKHVKYLEDKTLRSLEGN